MPKSCIIYVDGAAKGNPGPAGIGVLVLGENQETLREIAESVGNTTNNVAEYKALIRALEEARSLGCERVHIFTDSELLARQIEGRYAVKTAHLFPLYQHALALMRLFEEVVLTHIPREKNRRADALSNMGIQQAGPESAEKQS